jgi:hypothetical protein
MKKIKKEVEEEVTPEVVEVVETPVVAPKVSPITESFGSGDMNTLKNKINEIIKCLI